MINIQIRVSSVILVKFEINQNVINVLRFYIIIIINQVIEFFIL